MIRVQFCSIAQNPIGKLVDIRNLLGKPGNGVFVLFLAGVPVLDNDSAAVVLLEQGDQALDLALRLVFSTLDEDLVAAGVALRRAGLNVREVDFMRLKSNF